MAASEKPIVILVHGAWHVPLHFRNFIAVLNRRGYTVLAPPLKTCGVDDDIVGKTHLDDQERIRETLLPYLDQGKKAIVLAHSYGGIPATGAVEGLTVDERQGKGLEGGVVGVMYLAAYTNAQQARIRVDGGSSEDKTTKRPLSKEIAEAILYHDVTAERRDEALGLLVPVSVSCTVPDSTFFASQMKVPRKYFVCTNDQIMQPKDQYERAKDAGATVLELQSGHSAFLKDEHCIALADAIDNFEVI